MSCQGRPTGRDDARVAREAVAGYCRIPTRLRIMEAKRLKPRPPGRISMRASPSLLLAALVMAPLMAAAQPVKPTQKPIEKPMTEKWVTSWSASVQGPYPVGNPSAQPDMRFAFPAPEAGARDQTFRLIVRPDLWGRQARLRFSNALGTRPVTFDGVHAGLQLGGAVLAPGSNRPVTFAGQRSITVAPGQHVWSDPVSLPFVQPGAALAGRRLAVSFHVAGESGPMTWHAKALTTSYVTAPGIGSVCAAEDDAVFPYHTA